MANALVRNAVPDYTEASDPATQDWGNTGSPLWDDRANWRLRLQMALADKEREARLARGEGSTEDLLAHIGLLPVHMMQGLSEAPASIARSAAFAAGAGQNDATIRPDETQAEFQARMAGQPDMASQAVEAGGWMAGLGGGSVAPVTTNRLVLAGKAFGREPAGLPEAARLAADRPFAKVPVPAVAEKTAAVAPDYSGAAMTAAQMDDIIRGMGYDPRQLNFNQKSWLIQRERSSAAPGPAAEAPAVGGGEGRAAEPRLAGRALGPQEGGGGGEPRVQQAQAEADLSAAGEAPLAGLPNKPIELADSSVHVPGPSATARKAARDYMAEAGLPYEPPTQFSKVDKEKAGKIAQAFEDMKHEPDNPAVQRSYGALIDETMAQWEKIKATGFKVEFNPPGTDPYGSNPRMAMQDIRRNNHLWVFPTSEGFGSGAEAAAAMRENPMLRPTNEVISGQPAVANDIFRIVHDYFGHYKEGVGFRAEGEENAWKSHSAMYSEEAKPAMTSETRGQNSWVNYGPHGARNRSASGGDTQYAPQKIGLMPEWTLHAGGKGGRTAAAILLAGEKRGGLYSKALQVAEDKLPEQFTPAQAIATLKQAGLKAEELSPIEAHLQSEADARAKPGSNLPAKMTKADLLDHIQEGIPQIKERWYGGNRQNYDVSIGDDGLYYIVDEDGRSVGDHDGFISRERAERALDEMGGEEQPARFTKYSLEGGENKRNLLLQSPLGGAGGEDIMGIPGTGGQHYYGPHWDKEGEEDVFAHARLDDRRVIVPGYVVENAKSGHKGPTFHSFEEAQKYQELLPNKADTIVVKTKQSVKAQHTDEVQSDLHQEGRKKGYNTPEAHAEFARLKQAEKQAYDDWYAERERVEKGVFGSDYRSAMVARANAHTDAGRKLAKALAEDPAYKAGKARWEDAMDDVAAGDPKEKPPAAPFQKSEAWTALVWKRLIQEAVANGKDWVTWTTGKMQNDRYAMSNQIHALHYDTVTSGTRTKYVLKASTSNRGDLVAINHGEPIRPKDLGDFVGQDLAEKIIKGEGEATESGKTISGLDLNVGGKGMEGYYDDMTPKILKKNFGKYGVKEIEKAEPVGVKGVANKQAQAEATKRYQNLRDEQTRRLFDEMGSIDATEVEGVNPEAARLRDAARRKYNEAGLSALATYRAEVAAATTKPELHAMYVTPALKEAAQNEGFTLYAGGNKKAAMFGLLRPAEEGNKLGFAPDLRVRVPRPGRLPDKPLITQATTNKNAPAQLQNIDLILAGFPKAADTPKDWSRMMAHAFASDEVPVPPYAFIRDVNGDGAAAKIRLLTPGQIADADGGFAFAREMRDAYVNGELSPADTGKLFMWSFLSRGVSPYTQESLFIDAFEGADRWIQKAADGDFTKADLPAYKEWAATTAPKGSGQPGSGSMHNLNAFGGTFLLKMARRGADGISNLQRLHDMLSDPNMTGARIRREFLKFGEGVGIDNKVVSFTMLVAGHPDVMVIDRVQTRQLWDDGRFADRNIYDGVKVNKKVVTGTALANLTYGARGLLVYEAIERALGAKIHDIYAAAGRPQDASIGRYHWESWVAHSQQEASHGSLSAVLGAVRARQSGSNAPAISAVSAKEGEYGGFAYGARYARDEDGIPYFSYTTPSGNSYEFSVPAWRQFLADVKKRKAKVVPKGFKVTESGNAPWYEQAGVSKEALDRLATSRADRQGAGAVRAAGQDQVAGGPHGGAGDWRNDPIIHPSGAVLTPVDHDPFAK